MSRKNSWGGPRAGSGRPSHGPLADVRAGRRKAKEKSAAAPALGVAALLLARLCDAGPPTDATNDERHYYWHILTSELAVAWAKRGPEILAEWRRERPGTRPLIWWKVEAPRLSREFIERWPKWGEWVLERFCDPRRRVGGDGDRAEHVPVVDKGFPVHWRRVNPAAPPLFESEAAYLRRHDLLLPAEEKRLARAAFKPEALPLEFWPLITEEGNAP